MGRRKKDPTIEAMHEQEQLYVEKTHLLRAKRAYRQHTLFSAFMDWVAVGTGVTMFVFIVLWAASPDSLLLTFDQAVLRSMTYGVPITAGMWAISRATRKGSTVPKGMAEALPYARFGKDGKITSTTVADEKAGVPPTPLDDDQGGDVIPLDQPDDGDKS